MKRNLFLLSFLVFFLSCKKAEDGIDVKLLLSPFPALDQPAHIEYRDENGIIQQDSTTGSWSKEFNVKNGFNLYFTAKGKTSGNITYEVSAKGKGTNYSEKNSEAGAGVEKEFDFEVDTDL